MDGCSKVRLDVNSLDTAPGKRIPAAPGFWEREEENRRGILRRVFVLGRVRARRRWGSFMVGIRS